MTTLRRSCMLGVRSSASMDSLRSMIANFLPCSHGLSSVFSASMSPAMSYRVFGWRASSAEDLSARPPISPLLPRKRRRGGGHPHGVGTCPGHLNLTLSGIPNGAQEDGAVWNRGRFGVARCHASAVHDFHGLNVVPDDGVGLAYPDIADQNESWRGRPFRHRPPRRPRRTRDGLRKIGSQSPSGIA